MATVDGITELRPVYQVDCNAVVCQAVKLANNHTVIALVTQEDSWTKELKITCSIAYGHSLRCGDQEGDGENMTGLNAHNKMNQIDLGDAAGPIAIQFVKAKTFGEMTNYGTLALPESVNGHLIVFFWPEDEPGDHWNHFLNILDQGVRVTGAIAGIAENVVRIGKSAKEFAGLFGQAAKP
jgi:hypothetical protein